MTYEINNVKSVKNQSNYNAISNVVMAHFQHETSLIKVMVVKKRLQADRKREYQLLVQSQPHKTEV
jgi:hypothetical protein